LDNQEIKIKRRTKMENSMMSPADFAAINGKDGFGGGGAWWIIILFLFLMGQGGFGGNNNAATQEILFGQRFQGIDNKLDRIGNGISDATFALNNSITTEGRAIQTQLANCCCDLKTAVHAEGEATRALIQQNEIQMLRDKVASLEMDNRMCGVVRYPTATTFSSGNNPFCGCGCSSAF
jgi:hypothetical protein